MTAVTSAHSISACRGASLEPPEHHSHTEEPTTMKAFTLIVALLAAPALTTAGTWDKIKQGASATVTTVGGAVSSGAKAVGGAASDGAEAVTDVVAPDRSRTEIDDMAAATLNELFATNAGAKALFDQSFGYAVFDSRKMSFMITTAFGSGVAVERADRRRTYMKMASGGVNVGLGAHWYQVVFLFETLPVFQGFVNDGWDAGGGGSAVAANQGASLEATFNNGLAVYQITDKGLMLAADLTGTKYWRDDELNLR